ncbi:MAG: hypothetical protein ACTSXQ_03250 [Alphaproteobacteria bacterium]
MLAGHTHGGQIKIPFIGRHIVTSLHGSKYALGYIKEKGKELIVSAGIGTSVLPLRFLTKPEILMVTIGG